MSQAASQTLQRLGEGVANRRSKPRLGEQATTLAGTYKWKEGKCVGSSHVHKTGHGGIQIGFSIPSNTLYYSISQVLNIMPIFATYCR